MIERALEHASLGRAAAGDATSRPHVRFDGKRALQLALAGIWLLDAALQFQPFMFSTAFGQSLAAATMGNIGVISDPISWNASLVELHPVLLNAVFGTIQLLLAVGIAWRRTVRIALAASIAWSLAVWWLGEGMGGMLVGMASPLNGAPGAVIIYALLAVLLWPTERPASPAPFVAARAVGPRAARAVWFGFWMVLASSALWPQNRAPQGIAFLILEVGDDGEPAWLAALDKHVAVVLAERGLEASIVLAVVLALISVASWLPPLAARSVLVISIALAAAIWVLGEAFGGILTGEATDPNTGPLLVLLTLSFWPTRTTRQGPAPVGGLTAANRVTQGNPDNRAGASSGRSAPRPGSAR